jgi:hypothetical protein
MRDFVITREFCEASLSKRIMSRQNTNCKDFQSKFFSRFSSISLIRTLKLFTLAGEMLLKNIFKRFSFIRELDRMNEG